MSDDKSAIQPDNGTLEKGEAVHEDVVKDPVQMAALTPEELALEKKLVRRIDILIMPLIILVYLMNYIDRNNYAAARLQGLEQDLHLHGQQYETGLSILFVGYILMMTPSNLLLNYVGHPSLYLGFFVCAWGLVSALTSQVKSYGGIVACRFIMGFVEAPFFSGVLFYLSKWYTKKELGLRMSIFYSGSLLSGAFGNLIAAGILDGMDGKRGISAWQWLYIIEGAITVSFGLLIAVILPDFPENWKMLSEEMRSVAARRLAVDAAEVDIDDSGSKGQIQGLKQALCDVKTYILAIAFHCIVGASGFQNYFPSLTEQLGYDKKISLVLVAPPYIFMVFYSLAHSHLSDRFNNRFWFFIYPIPITIVGYVLYMETTSFGSRYASFFLMIFVFTQFGTFFSWIANAIPRPPAKRAAAYGFINAIGNSASIWTPYTYRDQDQPEYKPAMGICIALQILAAIMAIALDQYTRHQNRQLARMEDMEVELSGRDRRKLEKTAQMNNIGLEQARQLQRGFRFML
ncbi:hypothetical protein SI65_00170 [Aspergillus cristatus]|uniref:Major facilitator superfamily (MFS) profile domain-containing protein n=1 Tax=Aspergillus cristatus TaxID=573508 RepID=A0A1E3BP69_ASPCR|nr:hypothetical protein SI65_00170 [Aspergillus cristatus]